MKEKYKGLMKNFRNSFAQKVMLPISTFFMSMGAYGLVAHANNEIEATANGFVNNLIDVISLFGKYIGAALAAWGVIQLALAFKNEDADSKSRALMLIIASIILFNCRALLNMLGMNLG